MAAILASADGRRSVRAGLQRRQAFPSETRHKLPEMAVHCADGLFIRTLCAILACKRTARGSSHE